MRRIGKRVRLYPHTDKVTIVIVLWYVQFFYQKTKTHSPYLKEWVHLSDNLGRHISFCSEGLSGSLLLLGISLPFGLSSYPLCHSRHQIIAFLELIVKSNKTYKQCPCLFTHKNLLCFSHRLVEKVVIMGIWSLCPMSGHSSLYGRLELRQDSSSLFNFPKNFPPTLWQFHEHSC